MLGKAAVADAMVMEEAPAMLNEAVVNSVKTYEKASPESAVTGLDDGNEEILKSKEAIDDQQEMEIQMRENLNETAFFYPQLVTDSTGVITLKFTLPESLTTWRFMGLAHTKDLCYGLLEGEAVA